MKKCSKYASAAAIHNHLMCKAANAIIEEIGKQIKSKVPRDHTMTPPANQTSSPLDQFLTPEAMLTPGLAGATVMMITNALGINFNMPRSWTALALSFAFGLLAVVANKPAATKLIYYTLNSLVIFCVASGANNIGIKSQASLSLTNVAYAQATPSPTDIKACVELYNKIALKLGDIDKAKAAAAPTDVIKTMYGDYENLIAEGKKINGCGSYAGNNSIINNPNQVLDNFNSSNKRFFNPW